MSKNIVICSDGTGNTAIKGRGTNVFKLFEAVDVNGHRWDPSLRPQVAFYDDGVGTEDFKPLKILGGAAGLGLSRNVRQLYKELCRIYDPGDDIYVFGFSRGAFTVRTLVGLIAHCGVTNPNHPRASTSAGLNVLVDGAYEAYRRCYRSALSQLVGRRPDQDAGRRFRAEFAYQENTRVRFVGVWDTVDAVGLPFHLSDVINSTIHRFKFPDLYLSDIVAQACHALAIDEERHSFQPLLWDETRHADRIEQVWFAGVHSNVGGGYPKQGMSLVTLDWMLRKAEEAGLRFTCRERALYRECASADDKLYDSRAGLGTFYRWKPRDIGQLLTDHHVSTIRLHVSALERLAHGTEDYAPANLPADALVVVTPPDATQNPALIRRRAGNLQQVYRAALRKGSLLDDLGTTVLLGRISYYLFLVSCTALIATLAVANATQPGPWSVVAGLVDLTGKVLGSPWAAIKDLAAALGGDPRAVLAIVAGLAASSLMARATDRRISDVASEFWHRHRDALRGALKGARKDMAASAAPHVPLCWTSTDLGRLSARTERREDVDPFALA